MIDRRLTARSRVLVAIVSLGLSSCSDEGADPAGPGVVVSDVLLPVPGAAYRGSGAHLFFGGSAALTCSTHGVFSAGVTPPSAVGTSVVSSYTATFVGELVLQPPVVSSSTTYPLDVQVQMSESITLASIDGDRRLFETELTAFELRDGLPDEVVVRESASLASEGMTTVTSTADGSSRVEAYYDVWLEMSLDGGRSWEPAAAAVKMTLGEG